MLRHSASIIALAMAIGLAAPAAAQQADAERGPRPAAEQKTSGGGDSAAQKPTVVETDRQDNSAAVVDKPAEGEQSDPSYSRQKEIVFEGQEEKSSVDETGYDRTDASGTETVAPAGRVAENEMPGEAFTVGRDFLASDLIGRAIYGPDDENIGQIEDIRIGRNGSIEGFIVEVGGFLGLGDRHVAIAPQQLKVSPDNDLELRARTTLTRQELEQLPPFERERRGY